MSRATNRRPTHPDSRWTRTALALALLLVLGACGNGDAPADDTADADDTQDEAADGEADGDELYVFLPKSLDNPYWVDAREGMEDAAAELGVDAEFLGPQSADAAAQVEIFESVLARQPAGVAVSPNDPDTLIAVIADATAAGIPVIAWDSPVPDSEALFYIGTDNVAAGRTAGEALAEELDGEGTVAIVTGSLTALNAQQRIEGFEEALSEFDGIEVVTTETSGESLAGATSAAESILQAQPELSAIFGVTGSDAPGVANAVNQAGQCGDVLVAGFDVVPQGIELMESGCIQLLVSQRPFGMTAQALELLHEIHGGGEGSTEDIDTGVEVVKPDTLETFLEQPA